MRKLHFVVIAIGFALTTGCATYTDVREHKDLQQEVTKIHSVVILPPDVTIDVLSFNGDTEKDSEKQDYTIKKINSDTRYQLKKKGVNIVDFDFNKALNANPDLAFAITQCKESMEKSEKALYKSRVEEKNKSTFSENIGPSANAIAEATGADAFLVIKYKGFRKSGGLIAKEMAANVLLVAAFGVGRGSPMEGADIEIALVSAESGAILWIDKKQYPQLEQYAPQQMLKEFPQWSKVPVKNLQTSSN